MTDFTTQQQRILVVDDLAPNRLLLRRFLQSKGFRVDEADSGAQALEFCHRQNYDLVLMDIMMEGMSGQEAASQLKRINEKQQIHLPIIYVTALNSQDAYVEAMAAGGDDFISKPIDFAVLATKINAHLRIRSLYQLLGQKNAELHRFNQYLEHERNLVRHLLADAYERNVKPACCIRDHLVPQGDFNGDILLSDLGPGGLYYLLLGDFTGHGLASAVGSLPLKQGFFQLSQQGVPLVDMAYGLNAQLRDFLPSDRFCAAILLQLDIYSGKLVLWNGAMPDACVVSSDGDILRRFGGRNMPLGVLEDQQFEAQVEVMHIPVEACLYLHTDGLTEMTDGEGIMFGAERLHQLLATPVPGRFESVVDASECYRQGLEQEDDLALVEIDLQRVEEILQAAENAYVKQVRPAEPVIPFRLEMGLGAEDLRSCDPIALCSGMLAQQPGLRAHKDIVHTLFAELFNNALEHSLLGLGKVDKSDSRAFMEYYQQRQQGLATLQDAQLGISIALLTETRGLFLEIGLKDNGRGFDASEALQSSAHDLHSGRGLALLQQFGETLEYSPDGREVRLLYRLA